MENLSKIKGKFITFEGCEGVGKTTQSKLLVEELNKRGIDAIWTREPGGCENAEKIREFLLKGAVKKFNGLTELALLTAARIEHLENTIKPALGENKVVISDRYIDSTIAYQGYGQGVDKEIIKDFNKSFLRPNLTLILNLDLEEGLARANKRGDLNRFDKMELDFHNKVRSGFLALAEEYKTRIKLLDVSNKDIEQVHSSILKNIEEWLDGFLV